MHNHADAVAECVLEAFANLPTKTKPRVYPNGTQEATTLSGIVLSVAGSSKYRCVSLGTGMRCLAASKVALANGNCLHDWHAEIVALRGFNHFLLEECAQLLANSDNQTLCRLDNPEAKTPFAIRDDVCIHMYCSEAPCGDASMELTMSAQEDATPWTVTLGSRVESEMPGRGYFGHLGIVRRKPARGDAPITLSKSCSDKLALKQCTSLLNSLTSLLVDPANAYLHDLVLPSGQHVPAATARAFSAEGRMSPVKDSTSTWTQGYKYQPVKIAETGLEFPFQKSFARGKFSGCNLTAFWDPYATEIIIGGTKQGSKQFAERGASQISRRKLWALACKVASLLPDQQLAAALEQENYGAIKRCEALVARQRVKDTVRRLALHPWKVNEGDEDFGL